MISAAVASGSKPWKSRSNTTRGLVDLGSGVASSAQAMLRAYAHE
jgi:hypothetical protein